MRFCKNLTAYFCSVLWRFQSRKYSGTWPAVRARSSAYSGIHRGQMQKVRGSWDGSRQVGSRGKVFQELKRVLNTVEISTIMVAVSDSFMT